jgi:hypothetical protein
VVRRNPSGYSVGHFVALIKKIITFLKQASLKANLVAKTLDLMASGFNGPFDDMVVEKGRGRGGGLANTRSICPPSEDCKSLLLLLLLLVPGMYIKHAGNMGNFWYILYGIISNNNSFYSCLFAHNPIGSYRFIILV